MPALIALLVFASVAVVAVVFLGLFFSEERRVTKALRTVSAWEVQQASEAEPLIRPFRSRVLRPSIDRVIGGVRALLPADASERVRRKLVLAGDDRRLTSEGFVALRIASVLAGLALGLGPLLLTHLRLTPLSAVLFIAIVAAGYAAPGVWLDHAIARRQEKVRRALPDMLDMLTISVQAGLGFDMALVRLIQNTRGPLAEEFGRMLAEVQAGGTRRDALRHLGERTEVPELDNFITAMVQADMFGVSVSAILQAQSRELRKKRRQVVEEKAQKAPVKMVFPIILCMLPATLLVVLGPAIIAIGRTFGVIH